MVVSMIDAIQPEHERENCGLFRGDISARSIDTKDHPWGLDVVTRALSGTQVEISDCQTVSAFLRAHMGTTVDYEAMSVPERNAFLAATVLDACAAHGWVAGWDYLAKMAPTVGLHARLVDDVAKCNEIYSRIRAGSKPRASIDIGMKVVRAPDLDSLDQVGPKSLGGHGWMVNAEYAELQAAWTSVGFAPMGPCTSFGWLAVQKKIVSAGDADDCAGLQLVSTVDYDFDLVEANKPGFKHTMAVAARRATEVGERMQGAAIVAMLSVDVQKSVRAIQQRWAASRAGASNLGPDDVAPEEWVAATVADCAALCPFGYQSKAEYDSSRTGMFLSMLLGNIHDLLYDVGCSNRMSSVMYADAAGVAEHDIHCAFAMAMVDALARRVCALGSGAVPLYGDSAALLTGAWAAFNGRYRTWERFVKYTRLLARSNTSEAKAIVTMARRGLVLVGCDAGDDLGEAWKRATMAGAYTNLGDRVTQAYIPAAAPEVMDTPGVAQPDLCVACTAAFRAAVLGAVGEVHAIEGLPASVTACRAVGLAAAIRRAADWATSGDCCDVCACRIGCWADSVSYMVLIALMASEPTASPAVWLLQGYAVWSVTLWPVPVATVLSGFDLVGDLAYEEGAMGTRDVVDC